MRGYLHHVTRGMNARDSFSFPNDVCQVSRRSVFVDLISEGRFHVPDFGADLVKDFHFSDSKLSSNMPM